MLFLENLAKLFSLMDPNSPERVAFVSRALKWSSGGSGKLGHPRLHQLLALTLWKGRHVLSMGRWASQGLPRGGGPGEPGAGIPPHARYSRGFDLHLPRLLRDGAFSSGRVTFSACQPSLPVSLCPLD